MMVMWLLPGLSGASIALPDLSWRIKHVWTILGRSPRGWADRERQLSRKCEIDETRKRSRGLVHRERPMQQTAVEPPPKPRREPHAKTDTERAGRHRIV